MSALCSIQSPLMRLHLTNGNLGQSGIFLKVERRSILVRKETEFDAMYCVFDTRPRAEVT